jgi:hypothetical protein
LQRSAAVSECFLIYICERDGALGMNTSTYNQQSTDKKQGRYDVANEALTYSGVPPAGRFFLTAGVSLQSGGTASVLNLDRMASYIAEQVRFNGSHITVRLGK